MVSNKGSYTKFINMCYTIHIRKQFMPDGDTAPVLVTHIWYILVNGANSRDSGGGTNTQCLPANPEYLTTMN